MSDMTPFHVLIPAAGNGVRAGHATPKQYKRIAGKMILRHTIEKFLSLQGLKSIRIIIDPHHEALYREAIEGLDLPAPIMGAATRKQSVFNGLSSFSAADQSDLVLIHDAARPFISRGAILKLLEVMKNRTAATLAAPIADTLVNQHEAITAQNYTLDRDTIRAIQTPQAFQIALLKKAHEVFRTDESFTDDAGLVAALGETVALVEGSRDNFKITTSDDMIMAEKLLSVPVETRTGTGFDVHAFAIDPATSIRLGGIDIAFDKKLSGHSDADVVMHALTDALLGAVSEGDIGQIFPPSDAQWKGADSEIFLKEACRRVLAKGGRIVNADITIICEAPKIGPHRDAMQARIASILDIQPSRVSIKATTTEGLGFTGRREGIAAQALANVALPLDFSA